jgi:hypothetical protein
LHLILEFTNLSLLFSLPLPYFTQEFTYQTANALTDGFCKRFSQKVRISQKAPGRWCTCGWAGVRPLTVQSCDESDVDAPNIAMAMAAHTSVAADAVTTCR